MSVLAIEINDAAITVARDGRLVLESPGYALAEEKQLLVGAQAASRACLLPGQTYNRFWDELSTKALTRPAPLAETPADLVYRHMAYLWEQIHEGVSSVILCVPGCYTNTQLELLLGITEELGVPVHALLDSALAAVEPVTGSPSLLHLEAHLHRIVVTRLSNGGKLARAQVQVSREAGLVGLRNAWVKAIASQFVRATRFDPLHTAGTEQTLHDQLADLMADLEGSLSAELSVDHGHQRHTLSLSRETLLAGVAGLYGRIAALVTPSAGTGPTPVRVSHHLAQFPGMMEALAGIRSLDAGALKPGAGALGALARADLLLTKSDAFSLVTELPAARPAAEPAALQPQPGQSVMPTHLLHRGLAYALGPEPLLLGRELPDGARGIRLPDDIRGVSRRHCSLRIAAGEPVVEDHSTYGTFVNGERISGRRVLQVGDSLRLGSAGEDFQIIALAEP